MSNSIEDAAPSQFLWQSCCVGSFSSASARAHMLQYLLRTPAVVLLPCHLLYAYSRHQQLQWWLVSPDDSCFSLWPAFFPLLQPLSSTPEVFPTSACLAVVMNAFLLITGTPIIDMTSFSHVWPPPVAICPQVCCHIGFPTVAIAHTTDLTACQKLYLFIAGITFGSENRSHPITLRLTMKGDSSLLIRLWMSGYISYKWNQLCQVNNLFPSSEVAVVVISFCWVSVHAPW